MRALMAALVMALALGSTAPAVAQTHSESHPTDRSPSVTIDLATVGGGALGLVAASGLVGLYNAGSLMVQGAAFAEALEAGTGLPLLAAAAVVVVGGYYGQDLVRQLIAGQEGSDESDGPAETPPSKPAAKPAH